MAKKTKSIPVHSLPDGHNLGIVVGKMSAKEIPLDEASHAHRHDFHFFIIQEKGVTFFEVDFKKYKISKSSVLYIHPNQVHRFLETTDTTIYGLLITNENLHPEYIDLLEEITPVNPMLIKEDSLSILTDTAMLCIKSFERKQDRLYHTLLKDNCNALVALILSAYLEKDKPAEKYSRFEAVTKKFKASLERNFTTMKRPSDYAKILSISTPYLNECVKNTTGQPVSYHIQQRVILETKRLLYHSNKSVKEIATELGYDDYPYFSRLFTKVVGTTAITFKNKNLD
ncbi:helix-turn-helix domain-containing protein [Flavobacterium geliluteum]|uniref:AraC family transcriptional regulator n=1 Tax=Flavobacterium geliluteum TaxID=2816120 RepID=A0A941AV85_9FLAO|nr:helix-turn-helix domain-containing protein [Flavobacterium geliluteum]MBP4137049.1 AraC family transcriptional regulator [Flavobacterium geliluteum]